MAKELVPKPDDVALIMGEADPIVETSEGAARAIVERILTAPDVAGIFEAQSSTATKDAVGRYFRIDAVKLMESEYVDSGKTYMLLMCVDMETGEKVTLNSGARHIMAQLWALHTRDMLPVEVTIAEAAKAKQGQNAPLELRAVGETLKAVEEARAGR